MQSRVSRSVTTEIVVHSAFDGEPWTLYIVRICCMYVYMYVYVCLYVYAYTYINMCVFLINSVPEIRAIL